MERDVGVGSPSHGWSGAGREAGCKVTLSIRRVAPTRAATANSAGSSSCAMGSSVSGLTSARYSGSTSKRPIASRCDPHERRGGALAARDGTPRRRRAHVKRERAGALVGVQVGVAAGHRQTVRLAHGGARLDAHRHVEVLYEATDHDHLLGVLLAEVGDVRPTMFRSLVTTVVTPLKWARSAHRTLQTVGQPEHLHRGGKAGG